MAAAAEIYISYLLSSPFLLLFAAFAAVAPYAINNATLPP